MLSAIFKRKNIFRKSDDNIFNILLNKNFLPDLVLATKLASVPMEERTPEQNILVGKLMGTYRRHGGCPSHLFKYASRKLQEEYRGIHTQICEVLYEPFSITSPQN